jgi:alpha-amylase
MAAGESVRALWEASGLESPDLYMERTFAWLRRNALESETTTPSRYLKSRRVSPKLYFPGTSSERFMKASAMPGSDSSCGSIRRSIIRYAGTAALYSRMHYVHLLIGQLRGDKSRKKTAIEDLWKGQCGEAYWRYPGGGVDSPAVREAAYRSLIDAELTTRIKGAFTPGIVKADVDFDGVKEYIYQGADMNAYIHGRGAVLVELDALKARRNLCDLFVDAPEGDQARKSCFVDRLYAQAPGDDVSVSPWAADMGPFSDHHYDEAVPSGENPSIAFSKDGVVGLGGAKRSIAVTKCYSFKKKTVKVAYSVQNRSDVEASFWLGIELNLSLGPEALEAVTADAATFDPAALSSVRGTAMGSVSKFMLKSTGPVSGVSLSQSRPADVSVAAIGAETRQGLAIVLSWPITLAADETWTSEILLSVHD